MADDDPLEFLKRQFEKVEGDRLDKLAIAFETAESGPLYSSAAQESASELKYLKEQHSIVPIWKKMLSLLPTQIPTEYEDFISYIRATVSLMKEIGIIDEPTLFHVQKYQQLMRENIAQLSSEEFSQRLAQPAYWDELAFAFQDLQGQTARLQWIDKVIYPSTKQFLEEKYLSFFYRINQIKQSSPAKKHLDEAFLNMASQVDNVIKSSFPESDKAPSLCQMLQQRAEEDQKPDYRLCPLMLVSHQGHDGHLYFLEQRNSKRATPLLHLSWNEQQFQISGNASEYQYLRMSPSGARQEVTLADILKT